MLTSLNLSECSGIVALGQLSVLRGLDLLYCGGLLQRPESLGRLSALTSLQIGDSLISKRVY